MASTAFDVGICNATETVELSCPPFPATLPRQACEFVHPSLVRVPAGNPHPELTGFLASPGPNTSRRGGDSPPATAFLPASGDDADAGPSYLHGILLTIQGIGHPAINRRRQVGCPRWMPITLSLARYREPAVVSIKGRRGDGCDGLQVSTLHIITRPAINLDGCRATTTPPQPRWRGEEAQRRRLGRTGFKDGVVETPHVRSLFLFLARD